MAYSIEFHPKDGLKVPWAFMQDTISKLRSRVHIIEIKEFSGGRSNTINSYYWKIVIAAFMTEMGVPDSESGREYMHYDILGQELRQIPDSLRKGHTKTQRTRDMTGSEFWRYLGKCRNLFVHFYNYSYPDPTNAGYDTEGWEIEC